MSLWLLAACSAAVEPTALAPAATPDGADVPVLSDALKHNCSQSGSRGGFASAGLDVGATAVDFTLRDVYGDEYTLSRMLAEKPVVMVFGSFT